MDPALVKRGAQLAVGLRCASCHLPDYAGREQMPRLAHQRIDYLILSLTAYRDGRRSGIDTSMNGVMYGVSDQDIRALAHYLASSADQPGALLVRLARPRPAACRRAWAAMRAARAAA